MPGKKVKLPEQPKAGGYRQPVYPYRYIQERC